MKRLAVILAMVLISMSSFAQTKNIVETVSSSKDHSTLLAAVKAADLVETLQGAGPFTLFAPTNAAFDKLPAGALESLVKPENKEILGGILTYHAVAGKLSAADILAKIKAGNGTATLTTLSGGVLKATLKGSSVVLTDEKGGMSTVTMADLNQSNGVIHVVDAVIMPK
jgi:uncharacterized surface protein with fasciclin (FAS1) repeats